MFYKYDPDFFYNRVGPEKTSDIMRHYKEDIAMCAKHGHNSFRSSFTWARLFPDGKNVDPKAVAYYHDFIAEVKKHNMTVLMAILHFDLPWFIQQEGGLLDDKFPDKYAKYAEFLFKEFGKEVSYFYTFCEPIVPLMAGYLNTAHWPRLNNPKLAVLAGYHEILAHAKAVDIFNRKYRKSTGAKIATNVCLNPAIAKDGINFDKEDKKAAEMHNMLMNYALTDAMVKGTFDPKLISYLKKHDLLPETKPKDLKTIARVKTDFIAVNYYFPSRVQKPLPGEAKHYMDKIAAEYKWPKARINVFRG